MIKYIVTNANQLIDTVKAETLEECKEYLLGCGYTEEEVIDFNYKRTENTGIEAFPYSRNFEVVIKTLKFWAIPPGTLFFTKKQYGELGLNSLTRVKVDDRRYVTVENGLTGTMDREEEVYMVLLLRD